MAQSPVPPAPNTNDQGKRITKGRPQPPPAGPDSTPTHPRIVDPGPV